jgi:hypothetical protein
VLKLCGTLKVKDAPPKVAEGREAREWGLNAAGRMVTDLVVEGGAGGSSGGGDEAGTCCPRKVR